MTSCRMTAAYYLWSDSMGLVMRLNTWYENVWVVIKYAVPHRCRMTGEYATSGIAGQEDLGRGPREIQNARPFPFLPPTNPIACPQLS